MIENKVDNVGGQMVPFCQENRLTTRLLEYFLKTLYTANPKMETDKQGRPYFECKRVIIGRAVALVQ